MTARVLALIALLLTLAFAAVMVRWSPETDHVKVLAAAATVITAAAGVVAALMK